MLKLIFLGVSFGMLSNVTGIPLSPYYPIVKNNSMKFESTSLDQAKFMNFKQYVGSRF